MVLVRAIIRQEKTSYVLSKLVEAGFPATTELDVYGRGKQKGITVGSVTYDEIPKTMLLIVVEDKDEEKVSNLIMESARTGDNGNFGDGRIFVSDVKKAYTISSKTMGL